MCEWYNTDISYQGGLMGRPSVVYLSAVSISEVSLSVVPLVSSHQYYPLNIDST